MDWKLLAIFLLGLVVSSLAASGMVFAYVAHRRIASTPDEGRDRDR